MGRLVVEAYKYFLSVKQEKKVETIKLLNKPHFSIYIIATSILRLQCCFKVVAIRCYFVRWILPPQWNNTAVSGSRAGVESRNTCATPLIISLVPRISCIG